MMQAMSELMEQGDDFIMREQSRLGCQRGGEIAIQVSHRSLYAGVFAAAGYRIIHPRATALGRPCVDIEIKLTYERAAARLDRKEANVIVPNWRLFGADLQAI